MPNHFTFCRTEYLEIFMIFQRNNHRLNLQYLHLRNVLLKKCSNQKMLGTAAFLLVFHFSLDDKRKTK